MRSFLSIKLLLIFIFILNFIQISDMLKVMAFIRNQQNNWSYILIVLVITTVAAIGIINYTNKTIDEINYLSSWTEY